MQFLFTTTTSVLYSGSIKTAVGNDVQCCFCSLLFQISGSSKTYEGSLHNSSNGPHHWGNLDLLAVAGTAVRVCAGNNR